MAERPDYIACIGCSREPRKSWCGRQLRGTEFRFQDAEHAAENGAQEGRLVACPECAAAVAKALAHGMPTCEPPDLSEILSGETMTQRAEVCDAWAALTDDLRKDPRLTRLYRALGGPRMDDPTEAPSGVEASPARYIADCPEPGMMKRCLHGCTKAEGCYYARTRGVALPDGGRDAG